MAREADAGRTPGRQPRGDARIAGEVAPHDKRRGGFIRESWAELQKVEWPGQSQVIQATVVVLIACIVVGVYLYANDILWKHVVQRILNQ